jgi:predicted DNA-binding protein (UPF0251 family)
MAEQERNNGFVFYATFLDSIELLEKGNETERANKLMKAIINYGINKTYDQSDAVVNAMMSQITHAIDNAKNRYDDAVENGKKGGAKKKYDDSEIIRLVIEEKMTHKAVAEQLGCSAKTVQRAVADYKNRTKVDTTRQNNVSIEFEF